MQVNSFLMKFWGIDQLLYLQLCLIWESSSTHPETDKSEREETHGRCHVNTDWQVAAAAHYYSTGQDLT